jgi:ferredoxin
MTKKKARPDVSRCVACGVCKKECPRGAISIYKGCYAVVSLDICVACGICAKACPADVIDIVAESEVN